MTIAELFVNIGLRGGDGVTKTLQEVQGGLGEVRSSSLAAKAAILGVVYGLEQMMTSSAQQGMALQQFASFTGLSTERLQRWQYALRQSGVSADETASSFKGIQAAMTNMLLGKGAPTGFATFANAVALDRNRVRDTEYMMKKLQEFAKIAPPDIGNAVLGGMGMSPNVIQGLRRNLVDVEKIKKSLIFSDPEIAQLSRVQVGWENLWNRLKMFSGHMTASHGMDVVGSLGRSVTLIEDMIKGLEKLAKKFPEFSQAAIVALAPLAAAFAPITTAVTAILWATGDLQKFREGKDSFLLGKQDKQGNIMAPGAAERLMNFLSSDMFGHTSMGAVGGERPHAAWAAGPYGGATVHQTNTVHIHGADKPSEQANEFRRAVKDASRAIPALAGGH